MSINYRNQKNFLFFQTIEKLQREIECLNGRIGQLKEESETTKECFEAEKTHWIDEKEKVIRYQKQLQLNYVQVDIYILWNFVLLIIDST